MFGKEKKKIAREPISRRDFFAGQALSGFMAREHVTDRNGEPINIIEKSFEVADDMIEFLAEGK